MSNFASSPGLDPQSRPLARLSSRSALAADFQLLMGKCATHTELGLKNEVLVENALGRASTSARDKLYKELKGRYLLSDQKPLFSAFLAEWQNCPDPDHRQLLGYVLFCLNDRTVFLTSQQWLFPRLREAGSELRLKDLICFYQTLGRTTCPEIAEWTPITLTRVAQHYLASIRDFGFATGGTRKIAVRPALDSAAVRLLLRALLLAKIPTREIIRHDAFKILGIAPGEVVDVLTELNRLDALRFRIQADVIELSL